MKFGMNATIQMNANNMHSHKHCVILIATTIAIQVSRISIHVSTDLNDLRYACGRIFHRFYSTHYRNRFIVFDASKRWGEKQQCHSLENERLIRRVPRSGFSKSQDYIHSQTWSQANLSQFMLHIISANEVWFSVYCVSPGKAHDA